MSADAPSIPVDRWDAFREQRRDEIATAIIETVASGTAEQLNVSSLVERAGFSRKTFYKYFDSAGAALIYTHQLVLQRMANNEPEAATTNVNGRERVLEMLSSIEKNARRFPKDFAFLAYFDFVASGRTQGGDEAAFEDLMRRQQHDILHAFHVGQQDGSIRRELSPEPTLWSISNATFGLIQRGLVIETWNHQRTDLTEAAGLVVQAWRELLTPKPQC